MIANRSSNPKHLKVMVDKGEFLLKGYFSRQPVLFNFNGQTIHLGVKEDNLERFEKLKIEEAEVSETGILIIDGFNHEEEKGELAIDIKNLLTIGLGRRIIFDRQKYWTGNAYEMVVKEMSNNQNQGEQIIPEFELKHYLETTLPHWTNYSKKQKDEIFTITDYLNQTRLDFIEDRILRTVQAWECAANYWTNEVGLPADLINLGERIKQTFKQWKNDKNYVDHHGELGKRLTGPLDQEKLMVRLDKLINDHGLLTAKIDLDLRQLKDLRDKVAHTGRINITGTEAIKFLLPGIRGLQLILLKRMGYDGIVNGIKDNWRTIDKINEYFG